MLFFIGFLTAFLFAALTSAFSMIEIIVAAITKGDQTKRGKWTWTIGLLIFAVGIPSCLSYGMLDEPFSALDTITKGQIHTWYLDIMEKIDLSTIFITHDIDEAILLSNRIYIMTGSPGQIKDEIVIDRPRNDRKEFNLTEDFLSCKRKVLKTLENR